MTDKAISVNSPDDMHVYENIFHTVWISKHYLSAKAPTDCDWIFSVF